MNRKSAAGFSRHLTSSSSLLLLVGMLTPTPAAAVPIVGVSGGVFDLDNFVSLATAPVNSGAIANFAAFEQSGGPLSSSLLRALGRFDGFIAAGAQVSKSSRTNQEWSAHTQFRETFVNTSLETLTYVFDFNIFSMSLRIRDPEGLSHKAEIFAQVGINLPGASGQALFRIQEILTGSRISHTLTDGGTFVPNSTFTCLAAFSTSCIDFQYDFDAFHGNITLGTFAPGETFELQYDIEATASTRPVADNAARAFIGDPFAVTGTNGVSGTVRTVAAADPNDLPEPSTLFLLGGVIAGLAARSRRRF